MVSVSSTIEIVVTFESCHISCDGCSDGSETGCDQCASGFHHFGNLCLAICPPAHFHDWESNHCLTCDPMCSACFGPRNDQCSSCVSPDHFQTPNSCEQPSFCSDEYFFDSVSQKCLLCHSSCETCSGNSPTDCLSCDFGLFFDASSGECRSCSTFLEVPGLFDEETQMCTEVCGDGVRLGLVECDTLPGDLGCNEKCEVEEGWICEGGSPTSPDVC